ncbi:unnamed protein product [Camellia sinensis]
MVESVKPISSPVPDAWYPTLSVLMLSIGLVITASFFIRNRQIQRQRSLPKLASDHSSYSGGTTEEDLCSHVSYGVALLDELLYPSKEVISRRDVKRNGVQETATECYCQIDGS